MEVFLSVPSFMFFRRIIENKLWKGESRVLPVGRRAFQAKMGWNPIVYIIPFPGLHYRN